MTILSNTRGVESIRSSPDTDNQVIIIHNKFTISINVCPNIWSAVDFFVCWINLEALSLPKSECTISLQNVKHKSVAELALIIHINCTVHNISYVLPQNDKIKYYKFGAYSLLELYVHTFLTILRIGSTILRASTVPHVTLGNKGVKVK